MILQGFFVYMCVWTLMQFCLVFTVKLQGYSVYG